jgi:type I restriction enzyme S subunit
MPGKYQAYPDCKDSGVEWLGEIPLGWELTKVSWNFRAEKGKNAQLLTKDFCGSNPGAYPVYSGQTDNDGVMGLIDSFEFDTGTDGVLFSTTVGAKAMNLSHLKGKFSLSQNCMIIVPSNDDFYSRFSFYHFQPLFSYERGLIPEYMQASFRMDDLYRYPLAKPTYNEQKNIANFLDHETAKIDTLIEKQQQLIQLLKEKRQAVISHAVTKGLNPNASMRDSGVEWLSEVPEHWGIQNLRYVGTCQNGINIGAEYFGSGYPFVSYGDAYRSEVLPKEVNGLVQASELDRKTYSVLHGDVLFTRTSETIDEIGFASTCLNTIENATFAGFLIRFRPNKNMLDANFSKYYFRNILLRTFFIKEMNLVTRASLSQDLLKKLPVLLPPIEEQRRIAEVLDNKTSIFSKLIENAENAIKLMHERRTALIAAAVTGKIDVRGWQAPESLHNNQIVEREDAA